MSKVITKIALFIGYLVFAAFSAYFTATSLSLNLMQGTSLWLIYIMVFIVALLAGWLLTKFIQQITEPTSKTLIVLEFLGFIVFWGVSFTTNVHYFFVQKNGFSVLNNELIAAKDYLTENSTEVQKRLEQEHLDARSVTESAVNNGLSSFRNELNNTLANHKGFGDQCILYLKGIEQELRRDTARYKDHNHYVIYNDATDRGYKGQTGRAQLQAIYDVFSRRVNGQLRWKLASIDRYYDLQKVEGRKYQSLLDTIAWLEKNDERRDLRTVQQDGSVKAYYSYSGQQNAIVIDHMPQEFLDAQIAYKTIEGDDGEEIQKMCGYKTYPSKHMFDTWTVWKEILKGYMPSYMTIIQWILISLIIDIVAFLLLFLFFKN
mgnify:CR=1 FL=1